MFLKLIEVPFTKISIILKSFSDSSFRFTSIVIFSPYIQEVLLVSIIVKVPSFLITIENTTSISFGEVPSPVLSLRMIVRLCSPIWFGVWIIQGSFRINPSSSFQ